MKPPNNSKIFARRVIRCSRSGCSFHSRPLTRLLPYIRPPVESSWLSGPPVPHLPQLPAIRWKVRDVEQLARRTRLHEAAIAKLREVL